MIHGAVAFCPTTQLGKLRGIGDDQIKSQFHVTAGGESPAFESGHRIGNHFEQLVDPVPDLGQYMKIDTCQQIPGGRIRCTEAPLTDFGAARQQIVDVNFKAAGGAMDIGIGAFPGYQSAQGVDLGLQSSDDTPELVEMAHMLPATSYTARVRRVGASICIRSFDTMGCKASPNAIMRGGKAEFSFISGVSSVRLMGQGFLDGLMINIRR